MTHQFGLLEWIFFLMVVAILPFLPPKIVAWLVVAFSNPLCNSLLIITIVLHILLLLSSIHSFVLCPHVRRSCWGWCWATPCVKRRRRPRSFSPSSVPYYPYFSRGVPTLNGKLRSPIVHVQYYYYRYSNNYYYWLLVMILAVDSKDWEFVKSQRTNLNTHTHTCIYSGTPLLFQTP